MSLTKGGPPDVGGDSEEELEGSALRRIRRRLQGDSVAKQSWYQSVQEDGRDRMRLFGRRMLTLLVHEPQVRRQRQEALAEAFKTTGQASEFVGESAALRQAQAHLAQVATTEDSLVVEAEHIGGGVYRVSANGFAAAEDIGVAIIVRTVDGLGETADDRAVAGPRPLPKPLRVDHITTVVG